MEYPIIIDTVSAGSVEIKGPNLNSYPSNHFQISKDITQLYNGQILKAVVASMSNNKVLLELIEPKLLVKLEAPANSSLKLGQKISLQVAKLGPPLSLNVLVDTNTVSKPDAIINAALRLVIPKQSSMSQLLSNLHFLEKPNTNLPKTIPIEIINLSRSVLKSLPEIHDIKTAVGIKTALNLSGVFLEQHLLNNKPNLSSDTRTSLLRLAESIRSHITSLTLPNSKKLPTNNGYSNNSNNLLLKPNSQQPIAKKQKFNVNDLQRTPSNLTSVQQTNAALNELLRNLESSLAKIQYNQLQHFIPDDQSKSNWFFDLPIQHKDGSDIFHFKFTKKDSADNDKKDDEWSVTLTFSLEKLGHVSIQIYLKNDKVGATVWAKENETYTLFNQYISTLQLQMEKSGIAISSIRCNKGEIPQSKADNHKNLLDEQV